MKNQLQNQQIEKEKTKSSLQQSIDKYWIIEI